MTPSATTRGGRQATWTRDNIITALRRYADLYGPEFTAAAFSPSTALWRDRGDEYIDRYRAGDPDTGAAWPSLNAIKGPFGGSFNAAREAAGLPVNKPGPAKRRESGKHVPVRDAPAMPTRIVYLEKSDEKTLRDLQRRAVKAERRAEKAEAELARLRARPVPKAKHVTKAPAKVKVVKERDLAALTAARKQAKEARATAAKLASQLERAEAKAQTRIAALRAEKLKLSTEVYEAKRRVAAAEGEVKEIEVVREVEKVVERVVEMPAPEQAVVDDALREALLARQAANAAQRRAETSDRLYFELAQAVKGEQRRLTAGELSELRANGPAGPAVLADALKKLASARAGRGSLHDALTAVASAALSWRDRL